MKKLFKKFTKRFNSFKDILIGFAEVCYRKPTEQYTFFVIFSCSLHYVRLFSETVAFRNTLDNTLLNVGKKESYKAMRILVILLWIWSRAYLLERAAFSVSTIGSYHKSSLSQMFFKIGVFKNSAIFTWKQTCWSFFLIKLQAWRLHTGVNLWILRFFLKLRNIVNIANNFFCRTCLVAYDIMFSIYSQNTGESLDVCRLV